MKQKVLIIGGIGSGTVIAQAIIDANNKGYSQIEVEGFLNDKANPGDILEGIPVLAKHTSENIIRFKEKGFKFIYSLHKTDGEKEFIKFYYDLQLNEDMMATFVHPTAYVAPDVNILPGSVIMPYVMISAHATIGLNTLIMTGATIGHNTILGSFNHVASQAVVGAFIKTGVGANVGLNATVREYLTIGNYSTLGMGAVLTKNIEESEVWAGNPAKFLRIAK